MAVIIPEQYPRNLLGDPRPWALTRGEEKTRILEEQNKASLQRAGNAMLEDELLIEAMGNSEKLYILSRFGVRKCKFWKGDRTQREGKTIERKNVHAIRP